MLNHPDEDGPACSNNVCGCDAAGMSSTGMRGPSVTDEADLPAAVASGDAAAAEQRRKRIEHPAHACPPPGVPLHMCAGILHGHFYASS